MFTLLEPQVLLGWAGSQDAHLKKCELYELFNSYIWLYVPAARTAAVSARYGNLVQELGCVQLRARISGTAFLTPIWRPITQFAISLLDFLLESGLTQQRFVGVFLR